jgi:hypothetical protein
VQQAGERIWSQQQASAFEAVLSALNIIYFGSVLVSKQKLPLTAPRSQLEEQRPAAADIARASFLDLRMRRMTLYRCCLIRMRFLCFVAFLCVSLCAAASVCNVGNASSCGPLPVGQDDACYTCDNGHSIDAGSCDRRQAGDPCGSIEAKCEANGGVFTWCYGSSCNSCTASYRPLPVAAWSNKSVAFVTAHPDDLEALAGATVAALTKQAT